MKIKQENSHYLWPLAVLLFLTVGVFFTTSEVPNQHSSMKVVSPVAATSVKGTILSISILLLIFFVLLGGAFYFLTKARRKTLG